MSFPFVTPVVVSGAVLGAVLSAQIGLLGSPRYAIRESAFTALRKSGALGADLARKSLTHPDPEVRRRCEVLVREFEAAGAGLIKPTGYDFYPWISSLPIEIDKKTVEGKIAASHYEANRLRKYTGYGRPEYREATRVMVLDMFRAGVPKERIVAILDAMISKEKAAMQKQGLPFPLTSSYVPKRFGFTIEITPLPKKDEK